MRTVAFVASKQKREQVGHCETMFINVDELRIIFGVGLGVLSWALWRIEDDEANPCDRRSVYPFKLSL
jgi:hypothetical protein